MSQRDFDKAYQALLKENNQLDRHNKILSFELKKSTEKIARMEKWVSFRLGRIVLESKGIKGILSLPWRLWQLRKDVIAQRQKVAENFADSDLFEGKLTASSRKGISLSAEQIYEELKLTGKIGETLSKSYSQGKCVLSGVLSDGHAYLHLHSWYELDELDTHLSARIRFAGSIDVIGYIYFYDDNTEKIAARPFYRKATPIDIPQKAKYCSLALRIKGRGQATLSSIHIGEGEQEEIQARDAMSLSMDSLASCIVITQEAKCAITAQKTESGCEIVSTLANDRHMYLPIKQTVDSELLKAPFYAHLDAFGSLDIMGCVVFFDAGKKKLSHAMFKKREEAISVPEGCKSATLSLRIKGKGKAESLTIVLSAVPTVKKEVRLAKVMSTLSPMAQKCRTFLNEKPEDFAVWLKSLRVAVIMDEFTWRSYSPEADMLQLTPEGWHEELRGFKPDMLFVESAWRGKDELWTNTVHKAPPALIDILHWCRKHDVPTVFWNKEDPIHFETFIDIASLFDFVFTYDFHCVSKYKMLLKHDNVYYLPMGVQPTMFNPIEKYKRKDAFCFAGSYYKRYPERTRDLDEYITHLPEIKPVEIFDRQYGKNDPNYMFPDKYLPFIKGNLPYDQIDKAYKGYKYSINLNSLKQAQSLARRVYELMACNTLVISNFSRGVHSQMGELTILSDSAKEIIRRITELEAEPCGADKLRLAALRKVMLESTYQDRLAYIVAKVCGVKVPVLLPAVYVVARVETQEQAEAVWESYARQSYAEKQLLLISDTVCGTFRKGQGVRVLSPAEASAALAELPEQAWLACFAPEDYYGSNYLMDIMLAARYGTTQVIGKACFSSFADDKTVVLHHEGASYTEAKQSMPARRAAAKIVLLKQEGWTFQNGDTAFPVATCFAVDRFNYLKNGVEAEETKKAALCDIAELDTGISVIQMQKYAEQARPQKCVEMNVPSLNKDVLFKEFTFKPTSGMIGTALTPESVLHLDSTLPQDKHEYIYGKTIFALENVAPHASTVKVHLQTSIGLDVQMAAFFLDKNKQKLQSTMFKANTNAMLPICADAAFIRFALRVRGSGSVDVQNLFFGHRTQEPEHIVGIEDTLVLTNLYPAYDNLYRNAFVHSRVCAYRKAGKKVSVYQLQVGRKLYFDEFEGVSVFRGGVSALRKILAEGKVRRILVHFLNADMWEVLKDIPVDVRIIVWVHGAEIQPWTRRAFNYTSQAELDKAKAQSDVRMSFWKHIFGNLPDNIHFVFVSQYLANEVMKDNNIILDKNKYSIIHNPIDTDLFSYHKKDIGQRYKLLSIRPFASRIYANDITVDCILKLSERKDFDKFSIRIVGNGPLFDEIVKPLCNMPNVTLEKTFLTHAEIVSLHRQYGVFLVPTRADTQGVSRDEAMASGLVPVTNAVTAIPEFVDDTCGILAPAEDAEAMAAGISRLVNNPDLFLAMSKAAAKRVRRQTAANIIINQELNFILGEDRR